MHSSKFKSVLSLSVRIKHPANKTKRAGSSVIQHCRKTSHSLTKENRSVIQIQKALWNKFKKLKPLFSRNKELYPAKAVAENDLAS